MNFTAGTSLVLVTLGSEGVFYAFKNDSAAMECGFDAAPAGPGHVHFKRRIWNSRFLSLFLIHGIFEKS